MTNEEKEQEQDVKNKLFILYILDQLEKTRDEPVTMPFLQNYVFLVQKELEEAGLKWPDYKFKMSKKEWEEDEDKAQKV